VRENSYCIHLVHRDKLFQAAVASGADCGHCAA
jgi:hypothetical protein